MLRSMPSLQSATARRVCPSRAALPSPKASTPTRFLITARRAIVRVNSTDQEVKPVSEDNKTASQENFLLFHQENIGNKYVGAALLFTPFILLAIALATGLISLDTLNGV